MSGRLFKPLPPSVSRRVLYFKSARQNRARARALGQKHRLPSSAGSTASSASNWVHRDLQIPPLEGPEVLERGRHCGRDEEERLRRWSNVDVDWASVEGWQSCPSSVKTPTTFALLKLEPTEQRSPFITALKIHPAPPTFHPLILALLFFLFALFPSRLLLPPSLYLSETGWNCW